MSRHALTLAALTLARRYVPHGVTAALVLGVGVAACSGGAETSLPSSSGSPLLSGVSSGGVSVGGAAVGAVTGYGAANAFITTGYSEREIEPDRMLVRAKGSASTPVARIEKIALARAAEIGVETGKPYFKAGPPTQSVSCKAAKDAVHKSGNVPAERNTIVEIDVTYAKRAPDPSYQASSGVHNALVAELASDVVSPEAKSAAAAAMLAQCGK